ncbi:MAG: exo-alpha-sialidase, partial [Bacteroidaceae bacterium]|nr:exo-alpha-sialidase [Bacteroidaceae bacterium]
MILSVFSPIEAFAAVSDDATDGSITWAGQSWNTQCGSAAACSCGYMYSTDSNNVFHFDLEPKGANGYGAVHAIQNATKYSAMPDNFDVSFDFKMESYGEYTLLVIQVPDYKRVYFEWDKTGVKYSDGGTSCFYSVDFGYDWNSLLFELREDDVSVSLNGNWIFDFKLQPISNYHTNSAIVYSTAPSANMATKMQMKNFSITSYNNAISMTPAKGAVYNVGDNITLSANNMGWGSTTVDFYINNVKVKSVSKSYLSSSCSTSISGLPVGVYTVEAKAANGKFSFPRTFTVKNPDRNLSLSAAETVPCGSSAQILFNNTSGESINSVSYYVNGELAETLTESPYTFTASDMRVGTTSIYAMALLSDGTSATTDMVFIDGVATVGGSFDMAQEYELNYTYTSGNGSVTVNDGYFSLSMNHSTDKISYSSRDNAGAEYPLTPGGAGTYKVVVASGIAEVYRNGQFIFSDYLPTSSKASGMSFSGVSGVSLGGSGVKNELFRAALGTEREFTKEDIKGLDAFYSLEFDKKDASSESILLYDGEYEISVKFNGGIVAKTQGLTGGEITEKTICDEVEAGYYRLTVYRGLAQLFCDNEFLASFRAPRVAHKVSLRRTMSKSGQTTFVSLKNTDDIYYFSEDFQGTNEISPLEYWYDYLGGVTGTVSDGEMTISGNGPYLLDVTAENPDFKWDMIIPDSGDWTSGETRTMGIALRYRNEFQHIKIKYSLTIKTVSGQQQQTGKWSIVEANGTESVRDQTFTDSTVNETTLATASYLVSLGTKHTFEISIKNDSITLKCDGSNIFNNVKTNYLGNGKIGFDTGNINAIKVDNIDYAGNGKVNSGVNYTYWQYPDYSTDLGVFEGKEEGQSISAMSKSGKNLATLDKGATWTEVQTDSYDKKNYIKLASGNWLCVEDSAYDALFSVAYLLDAEGNLLNQANVQHSGDGMSGRVAMGNGLVQGTKKYGSAQYPRVYYVATAGSEEKGEAFVYYSDDEGRTWKYSKTNISTDALEDTLLAEPSVVELPDHTVRIYLRTDKGFVYSIDSFDGAVTFDRNTFRPTQFIAPSSCMSVCRDEENPEKYYMIWEYEPTTANLTAIQLPRNRTAIAVSYDGCESWEYIMEADDWGPVNDMLNHADNNMSVVNGVAYGMSRPLYPKERIDGEYIGAMTYAIDTAKMKTLKRFTSPHYIKPNNVPITVVAENQAVLPKSDGTAMIFGDMYPARANDSGFVENAIVAKSVGAVLSETTGGIRLSIGEAYVDFTKNSAAYSVNGTAFTAEEICLSEDGAYLNPEVVAAVFGKIYKESNQSHFLLTADIEQSLLDEIENLVVGVPEELSVCIEEFKTIGSWEGLKEFFVKYKYLLNLYTDFSDASYKNMYKAYTELDKSEISDYATLDDAIQTIIDAERGKLGEFLTAINTASAEGDGVAIKTLLTETYKDMLSFVIDTSDVKNDAAIYKKMTGLVYSNVAEIENVFRAAYEAQLYAETGKSDTISLSTASRDFDGWSALAGNTLGGAAKFVKDGENITRLSAYAGMEYDKTKVEDTFQNGLIYYPAGAFDDRFSSSGVECTETMGV